jgi:F-type H+-transporting ATPase subunit gamma
VLLDAYVEGEVSAVYLCYTKFINTMKQEPVVEQLLPLSAEKMQAESQGQWWQPGWEKELSEIVAGAAAV